MLQRSVQVFVFVFDQLPVCDGLSIRCQFAVKKSKHRHTHTQTHTNRVCSCHLSAHTITHSTKLCVSLSPYLRMYPPLIIICSLSSTTRDDGG